jgi:hypothetical protein
MQALRNFSPGCREVRHQDAQVCEIDDVKRKPLFDRGSFGLLLRRWSIHVHRMQ